MKVSWRGVATVLIVAIVAGCCSTWWRKLKGRKAGDCVYVQNARPGARWRLILDGQRPDGTTVNDKRLDGNKSPQHVGRMHSWATSNLIAAFQRRRPPKIILDAGWTVGNDDVKVKFKPEIEIDIVVWIVHGPYDDVELAALDAITTTTDIFREERMGVRFGDVAFHNATADAKDEYLDFQCTSRVSMQNDIGFEAGKINIYFVRSVKSDHTATGAAVDSEAAFNIYAGDNCIQSDFVVVSSAAGDTLLVHEVGHCLAMEHTNSFSDFDSTNVMWDSGNSRMYLAEGQLFRAHVLEGSALNAVYHARPGEPTLPFAGAGGISGMSDYKKLARRKRLFADGTYPPN